MGRRQTDREKVGGTQGWSKGGKEEKEMRLPPRSPFLQALTWVPTSSLSILGLKERWGDGKTF